MEPAWRFAFKLCDVDCIAARLFGQRLKVGLLE